MHALSLILLCVIFAVDDTRVKLSVVNGDECSDYINANFINVSCLPLTLPPHSLIPLPTQTLSSNLALTHALTHSLTKVAYSHPPSLPPPSLPSWLPPSLPPPLLLPSLPPYLPPSLPPSLLPSLPPSGLQWPQRVHSYAGSSRTDSVRLLEDGVGTGHHHHHHADQPGGSWKGMADHVPSVKSHD